MGKILIWLKALPLLVKIGLASGSFVALAAVAPSPLLQQSAPAPADVAGKQKPQVDTKMVTETVEIPFETQRVEDAELDVGKEAIKQQGKVGTKNLVFEVTYEDGRETSKVKKNEEVVVQPVAHILTVGTKAPTVGPPSVPAAKPPTSASSNCDPNYVGYCVPNVTYDLDCPDIGGTVRVVGYDKHGFDRDKDGYGCE